MERFELFNAVEKLVREANRALIAFPVLHIDFFDSQNLGLRDDTFSDDRKSFISCRKLVFINDAPGSDCGLSLDSEAFKS
jgi:hypothetical protein